MLNGHSTGDALRILHDELKANLDSFIRKRRGLHTLHFTVFDHRATNSIFHWTSGLYLVLLASLLGTAFTLQTLRDVWILAEVAVLIICLIINIVFTIHDNHLKLWEPVKKATKFLSELAECSKKQKWTLENYINPNCPVSQCLSLQWTIRDTRVINLPCSLLVEGDVILLRPGQTVPANCCSIRNYPREKECVRHLKKDEVYNPPHIFAGLEGSNNLSSCTPLQPEPHILHETPSISSFKLFLEKSNARPCGVLDRERFRIYSTFCERKVIPVMLILMLIINIPRYFIFKEVVGSMADMIIVLQTQSLIPLLALTFPVMWRLLDLYGAAKVLVAFENIKKSTELPTMSLQTPFSSFVAVMRKFADILVGNPENLPRSVNITQSLGHLTSFCCTDKKGVLSWPNPSAEKLFFLTNAKNRQSLKSPDSFIHHNIVNLTETLNKSQKIEESCSACQVLNLTQDTKNHNSLFFDDCSWKRHIASLKPLGLSILLNTCNMKTTEQYTEFSDHVKCMSLKQKEAVPVVNRRCFCELSRQIGFSDQASEIFVLEDVFGIYQHDTSFIESDELIHREKYKMPMPNAFCVLVRDVSTDDKHLFSQGMADLLLSMCTDYWDGSQIQPLGNVERKKIADFYHRNSMTSYCTAFSYRPFNVDLPSSPTKFYLEVSENLFGSLRHLETSFLNGDAQQKLPGRCRWADVDSIDEACPQPRSGDLDATDAVPLKYLGKQVFVGMVTMQYQAKQEIVNLIESLESNCIRFVHFSKENELRSRGFSEKMGLEAGWNCHISLLNEVESAPRRSEKLSKQKLSVCGRQKSFGSAPILKVDFDGGEKKFATPEEVTVLTAKDAQRGARKSLSIRRLSINANLQLNVKPKKPKKRFSSDVEGLHFHPLISEKSEETSHSNSTHSLYSSYMEGLSDIQNRARLPKGIENIRPHINDVDNVPLQVSLFTDCTTSTTCEMLKILQEYAEVTCCFGSSLNIDNPFVFLQGDCSVSKDPVYPQICNQQKSFVEPQDGSVGPLELSSRMLSLSCFLAFRDIDISCFPHLVALARTHCQRIRTAARVYLSFQLFLSCLQLVNSLIFLPPSLSPMLILWLVVVVVPIFGLSMMGNPSFPQVMPSIQGKDQGKVFYQWMSIEVVGFLIRYFPSIFVCLVIHTINLYEFCCLDELVDNNCDCHILFGKRRNETSTGDWNGWMSEDADALRTSQHFTALQIVFYFVSVSMCNVRPYGYLWKHSPLQNKTWSILSLVLISIQVAWFFTVFSSQSSKYSMRNISLASWLICILWIPALIFLHEFAKKREIKVWIRHQKRARLDFGTKLGMNSPF